MIDGKFVAALGADVMEVLAEESGGHGSGGDDERFDEEGACDECEDQREEELFEEFANRGVNFVCF